MCPGQCTGQEGSGAGSGEVAAGKMIVIDDGSFRKAGDVRCREAVISIDGDIVGGECIEDHDDDVFGFFLLRLWVKRLYQAWTGKPDGEYACQFKEITSIEFVLHFSPFKNDCGY